MDILNSVLTYGKPSQWEDASYTRRLYNLFDLQPGDPEYMAEVLPFESGTPRLTVTSLQRYQNPTLLGKFIIRKDQLLSREQTVKEMKYYHPIAKHDFKVALEFNMDVRRYTRRIGFGDDKDPKFFQTPGAAYNAMNEISEKVILVCKVLSTYEGYSISRNNDAEYMPIYVAEVN